MRRKPHLVLSSLILGAATPIATAATYVVSTSGPYTTIQSAINAASDGDLILIGNGTWSGPGNYDLSLGGRELTIRSSSGVASQCIINCDHDGKAITFTSSDGHCTLQDLSIFNGVASIGGGVDIGINATATLRNVRILGCYASTRGGGVRVRRGSTAYLEDCNISNNQTGGDGGGVSISSATVSMTETDLVNNQAVDGAAVFIFDGDPGVAADVTIEDAVIQGNTADGDGGAIYVDDSSLTLRNSAIYQNEAATNGGALALVGAWARFEESSISSNDAGDEAGAVHHSNSQSEARRTSFRHNEAPYSSAVRFEDGSSGEYVSCEFSGNEGGSTVGLFGGSDLKIANALFFENDSAWVGAGLYVGLDCDLALLHSTVADNHTDAGSGAGVYVASGATAVIVSSIVWQNDAAGATHSAAQVQAHGSVAVEFSCIENLDPLLYLELDCIDADPMFADAGSDNYRLGAGSPARDAGHPSWLAGDWLDLDDDFATVQLPLDLDDTDRVKHGRVDMGAYEAEFSGDPADLDGDGIIDSGDLLILLGNWGGSGTGDVNGDGVVDLADLLILLSSWD